MIDRPDAVSSPRSGRDSATTALWSVQLMRAAAALMIVIGHSQSAIAALKAEEGTTFARLSILPWGASVDLFFVISGFIMVHASGKLFGRPGAAGMFIRRRLARIVPLYWLVTCLYLALLAVAHWKGGDPFPSFGAAIASFLFLPVDTRGDGRAFPVFDLGWTLNYEMFFYAMFAVAVMFPRRRAVVVVVGLAFVLVAAGLFVPTDQEVLRFWTRPIIFDFVLGLGIGLASAEGVKLPTAARITLVVGAVLILSFDPAGVYTGPLGFTVPNEWPRVIGGGLPVAALLAGAVLGPEPRLPWMLRPFERLGDASYSLYLFHPFAMIVTEKAWQKLPAIRAVPGSVLVLVTIAGAVMLALIAYRWIEQPITRVARRLLGDGPSRPRVPIGLVKETR